ncbi:MAG: PqqD family protein [Acidobacteria bacterium]|nr:PqqD family protein [Acidobacteriota bacterium]
MNVDMRYEPDGEYVVRTIEGETLIVPIRHHRDDLDSIFRVNEVGTLIWKSLASGKSVGETIAALQEQYEVEKTVAASDVADFLQLLQDRKLIRIREPHA